MKGFILRAGQRLRMANYWLIAQAAMGAMACCGCCRWSGAQLRRPRRATPRAAVRPAPRGARQSAQGLSGKERGRDQAIALDMWGNMARLAAEYIFLDQLFDYDPARPDAGPHRGRTAPISRARRRREEGAHHLHRPSRQFRAAAGGRRGLRAAGDGDVPPAEQSLHRRIHPLDPPRPDGRADAVARAAPRSRSPASSKTAATSACWSTRSSSTASGRPSSAAPCETNPLLPKLARQFDCDVYPARCMRLPGNRFRLELEEKLDTAARRRRQGRRRRHRAAAQRRGRALGARGSRPVDVVPQALEDHARRAPTGRERAAS